MKLKDGGKANNTCRSCKYWADEKPRIDNSDCEPCRWDGIQHISVYRGFKLKRQDGFVLSNELSFFYTGPDFGCIHWEKRPIEEELLNFTIKRLRIHTPLKSQKEAIEILLLVDFRDNKRIDRILDGEIPFKPFDTYFERLKKALMLGEV